MMVLIMHFPTGFFVCFRLATPHSLWDLGSPTMDTLALALKAPSPNHWTTIPVGFDLRVFTSDFIRMLNSHIPSLLHSYLTTVACLRSLLRLDTPGPSHPAYPLLHATSTYLNSLVIIFSEFLLHPLSASMLC